MTAGNDGIVTLKMDRPGVWALKVYSREPATGAALKDYEYTSFTATLTLEVRP